MYIYTYVYVHIYTAYKYNKGYTITSIDVKDNMNNRFAFDLIDVKENSLKDDSIFQFKIPEGCRIIDLR